MRDRTQGYKLSKLLNSCRQNLSSFRSKILNSINRDEITIESSPAKNIDLYSKIIDFNNDINLYLKHCLKKTFEECDITILDNERKEEFIQYTSAKNLDVFLDAIANLNVFKKKGGTRDYIKELVSFRSIAIPSPFDDSIITSGSSVILDDKTTVFSFPSEPRILLSSGDMGAGYPLCVVLFVELGLIVKIFPHDWGFSLRHLPKLQESISVSGWQIGPVTKSPTLVTGDANFAHNAWNQLPAIADLIEPLKAHLEGVMHLA